LTERARAEVFYSIAFLKAEAEAFAIKLIRALN
jgi:hypothetical protein